MGYTNLKYRCLILPFIASILYYIISTKKVSNFFEYSIPDYHYALMIKSLLIFILLIITCRIIDNTHSDLCHDTICDQSLYDYCNNLLNNPDEIIM